MTKLTVPEKVANVLQGKALCPACGTPGHIRRGDGPHGTNAYFCPFGPCDVMRFTLAGEITRERR